MRLLGSARCGAGWVNRCHGCGEVVPADGGLVLTERDALPGPPMQSRQQKRPGRKELHFLNDDGMVACNPRDREAAHRADAEGIATDNPHAVTCKKCRALLRRLRRAS